MDMVSLLISLVSGAVGGNVAGAALKNMSLGTTGNSIAGILGGGLVSVLLPALGMAGVAPAAGGLDLGAIVREVVGGGVGGAVLMAIIGIIRNAMASKA